MNTPPPRAGLCFHAEHCGATTGNPCRARRIAPSSGNPFEDRARGLKAQRLALILWEAGLRRAGEVKAMSAAERAMALEILRAGLGSRRPVTASEQTWAGVASLVGWLGGGSGGRRQVPSLPQSRAGLGARDVTRRRELVR